MALSFRLKRLTDLKKYVKKQDVQIETATSEDIEMEEVPPKKERFLEYNIYTDEDRRRYFYFLKYKLMKPKEAAIGANVNYHTTRKWKKAQADDPEGKIPTKVTNKTPGRPASQLNDVHKTHFVDYEVPTLEDFVKSLDKDLLHNGHLNCKQYWTSKYRILH
ncbi:hypothetical protein INT45_002483 [Circinella minor]|uniref:Uncharacterized protein n=1 Tax=Circinella minor TaxID=1195481 RepID=A0A8H7SD41_9FUNG|nr:hypothetical protein INT45_002483 [Circinella minor]